jgi:hypothetical protein
LFPPQLFAFNSRGPGLDGDCGFGPGCPTAPAAPHPLERLLAEGEAARSRSIPKPEDGVRDMQWSEFSPRGWKPALTLDKTRVGGWKDDDPRALKLMAELQKDWQKAPAVTALPDGLIRIYGYPAMPEGEAKTTKKSSWRRSTEVACTRRRPTSLFSST